MSVMTRQGMMEMCMMCSMCMMCCAYTMCSAAQTPTPDVLKD